MYWNVHSIQVPWLQTEDFQIQRSLGPLMGPLPALVCDQVNNLASLLRESMRTVVGVATKRRESKERKRTQSCCPQGPVIWTCLVPLEEPAAKMTWNLHSILDV